jgi:NAD+ synthase (glutamine-hydrolysing)
MKRPREITVSLIQMEVAPGCPSSNTERMLTAVAAAQNGGVDLVVFPEMSIPGYLIGDEWEREAFLRDCEAAGERLRASAEGITVIFGNVAMDWTRRNEDGRVRKYNGLFVAHKGRFVGPENGHYPFVIKTLLPNYREFDDSRHFFDIRKLALEENRPVGDLIRPVPVGDVRLGCILCEDAWDLDYAISPLRLMGEKNPDLFINISCSPFTLNKNHKRNRVFNKISSDLGRPLAYVNNVGIQDNGKTVFTFDGASCIYDGQGGQVKGPSPFTEGVLTQTIPLDSPRSFGQPIELKDDDVSMIHAALSYGTRKFMDARRIQTVTVGVSGGIDSAVVAALYRTLLPPDRVLLVNMPGRFNSGTTRNLARNLAANLGAYYTDIPIGESVDLTRTQIQNRSIQSVDGSLRSTLTLSDFMLENVQARDRSSRILAAASSAFGGVFTCNANKSETTVGYSTLYGDLCGYLANLADLWKGEVYALAHYLNGSVYGREVIPRGSIDIVPSAELSAAQAVDEGKGDPLIYPYHDCLFRSWVEWWNRATPEENLVWYLDGSLAERLGYPGRIDDLFATATDFIADLERWWNQYQGMAIAKRIQAPPILAIKRRAFGFDHRESQIGPRYTRKYGELKAQTLNGG